MCADEMRNPSAYVSNFLNAQICCILIMILYASLVLGLGLARTMLIFEKLNELFLPTFSISNFRTGVRARGVANFTGVAASGGGVHPCLRQFTSAKHHDKTTIFAEYRKNVGGVGFLVNDTWAKWGFEIWPLW